ncbi:RagB/SusD family nutrient uptake outer membrane protein [Bacteroidota bacterium]
MKKLVYILLIIGLIIPVACTDLEEEILDKTTGEENLVEENLKALVAPAYNTFGRLYFTRGIWALQQATTTETLVPTRGTDWFDGGMWQQNYTHSWTSQHDHVVNLWNLLAEGMARANYSLLLIEDFDETQEVKYYRAELKFLVCLYMYYYVDFYGLTPYRDYTEQNFGINPKVYKRQDAFDVIVNKLEGIMPDLGDKGQVPYGRPTKDAAKMLLAKLYLNKEVYTGESGYSECLNYLNEIINSGNYNLAGNYFDLFSPDNYSTTSVDDEAILLTVLNDEEEMGMTFNWHEIYQLSFHYNHDFPGIGGGYNGYCTSESYFNDLIEHIDTANDVRWHDDRLYTDAAIYCGFNYGTQYNADGTVLNSRQGSPLIYTPYVSLTNSEENNGVRIMKYYPRLNTTFGGQVGNDFLVFRYADALLMKAECLYRANNDASGALAIVNELRTARRSTSIDQNGQYFTDNGMEEILLRERGIELYYEAHRRQDEIRFGVFLQPKDNKTEASAETKLVLPIPQTAIDAIDDENLLKQNTGY